MYTKSCGGHQKSEGEKLDLSRRAFAWTRVETENKFVCNVPPARATVRLSADGSVWSEWVIDLEIPDRPVLTSTGFSKLTRALDLAEKWLTPETETKTKRPPAKSDEAWAKELKRVYGKRWIDPKQIDIAKPAYAIIIELHHAPVNGKLIPISFGATKLMGDKYPSADELEREIKLPAGQFNFTQPLGNDSDWFRISSITSFHKKSLAESEAQRIWNECLIAKYQREGKVIRVRYGVMEKAIHYCTWIGECGETHEPWSVNSTRREHLLHMAIRATMISTLDVNRFRAFLDVGEDILPDNQLLRSMHRQRSTLEWVSVDEQNESAIWLVTSKAQTETSSALKRKDQKPKRK